MSGIPTLRPKHCQRVLFGRSSILPGPGAWQWETSSLTSEKQEYILSTLMLLINLNAHQALLLTVRLFVVSVDCGVIFSNEDCVLFFVAHLVALLTWIVLTWNCTILHYMLANFLIWNFRSTSTHMSPCTSCTSFWSQLCPRWCCTSKWQPLYKLELQLVIQGWDFNACQMTLMRVGSIG